jgi:hypothetical protein
MKPKELIIIKLCLLLIVTCIIVNIAFLTEAQESTFRWIDDFKYGSIQQLQNAGWTISASEGVTINSNGVILNGTNGDVSIHYANPFPAGITDWKIEVKSKWLGQGHSVLSAFIQTEKHSYGFAADGYYKEFTLYRDDQKILHFGNYQEQSNEWITLTMVKQGTTISMFSNGNLINTYNEEDNQLSQAIGASLVSPWKGNAEYDYIMVGNPDAESPTSGVSSQPNQPGLPTSAIYIGGGIAAILVGGTAVYYFMVAGGSAGASAGAESAGVLGGIGTGSGSSSGGGVQPQTAQGTASAGAGATSPQGTAGAEANTAGPSTGISGAVAGAQSNIGAQGTAEAGSHLQSGIGSAEAQGNVGGASGNASGSASAAGKPSTGTSGAVAGAQSNIGAQGTAEAGSHLQSGIGSAEAQGNVGGPSENSPAPAAAANANGNGLHPERSAETQKMEKHRKKTK